MIKKNLVIGLFLIAIMALINPEIRATNSVAVTGYIPYNFLCDIGEVVEYDKDWWEITARLEQKADVDGKIYPWYRLTRPYEGKVEHKWVWACPIDKWKAEELGMKNCPTCDDDDPPCPNPPC